MRPVNSILNRPKTKLGLDFRLILLLVLLAAPSFLWISKLLAVFIIVGPLAVSAWMTRKDSRMPMLQVISFFMASYYDPRLVERRSVIQFIACVTGKKRVAS